MLMESKNNPNEDTAICTRLAREWEKFVVLSGALQKVFVSVKGIFYQAVIHGEQVTWMVPHRFTQYMPKDVDFRLMGTFLEFYTVAIKFVMFKLYHELGTQSRKPKGRNGDHPPD